MNIQMKSDRTAQELELFARSQFPGQSQEDLHYSFRLFRCRSCSVSNMLLTIEHHTGSSQSDFKGRILGRCEECGAETVHLSFTGSHRICERILVPGCECGSRNFMSGECEGFYAKTGFFEEGVIAAHCSTCGTNQVLVYTD
jgi:hypothetical protein